jgi:hypothetical protein
MDDAWFTRVADELARCLVDARACAEACEQLLEEIRDVDDGVTRQHVISALVGPAAVARVLVDLIEQPPSLVLAACRLCRESAESAVLVLEANGAAFDGAAATAALRAAAASCQRLIDAAS